jgi:hypothetical protein
MGDVNASTLTAEYSEYAEKTEEVDTNIHETGAEDFTTYGQMNTDGEQVRRLLAMRIPFTQE